MMLHRAAIIGCASNPHLPICDDLKLQNAGFFQAALRVLVAVIARSLKEPEY